MRRMMIATAGFIAALANLALTGAAQASPDSPGGVTPKKPLACEEWLNGETGPEGADAARDCDPHGRLANDEAPKAHDFLEDPPREATDPEAGRPAASPGDDPSLDAPELTPAPAQ